MPWYPSKEHKPIKNKVAIKFKRKTSFKMPPRFCEALTTRHKWKLASPKWLNYKHRRDMGVLFRYAQQLTNETGIEYQVDHIESLTCKNSCGLHVPWNLRVITKSENMSKHAKRVDDFVSPWCVFPTYLG